MEATLRKRAPVSALLDPKIVWPAIGSAFAKLDPRSLIRNPVMFVLEVVSVLTTVVLVQDFFVTGAHIGFEFQIVLWLWFTVLFANFAEAVAEGRGKAQADALRKTRKDTIARRLRNKREEKVPAPDLQKGDVVVCEAGDVIPADGEVIEGIASVDEAAIRGRGEDARRGQPRADHGHEHDRVLEHQPRIELLERIPDGRADDVPIKERGGFLCHKSEK